MNKNAFRNLSYGVYVVSTWDKGKATGCVANSAMQITSDPATIAVSINHANYTNECIKNTGRFSISILSEETDPSVIGRFGFQSGRDTDKYDGIEKEIHGYLPIVKDCCAYVTCKVIDTMETSTHTVFLGEVEDCDVMSKAAPMTYSYYHKVIKGKSPKNAPTYIAEEVPVEKTVYTCGVCGYVYEGEVPFEDLPEDYVCPICRQPKSVFVKK